VIENQQRIGNHEVEIGQVEGSDSCPGAAQKPDLVIPDIADGPAVELRQSPTGTGEYDAISDRNSPSGSSDSNDPSRPSRMMLTFRPLDLNTIEGLAPRNE